MQFLAVFSQSAAGLRTERFGDFRAGRRRRRRRWASAGQSRWGGQGERWSRRHFSPSCREGRGGGGGHCMGVWIHIQDLFEHRPPRAGFGGLTPRPRVWRPPVSVMTPPVMKGRKRRVVALRTVPRMARCASNGAIRLANHAAGGRVLVAKLERSLANRHVGKRGLYPLFEGPRCFRWVNKPSRF
jgi:hypothetical protein